jgi:hypothetical protein
VPASCPPTGDAVAGNSSGTRRQASSAAPRLEDPEMEIFDLAKEDEEEVEER